MMLLYQAIKSGSVFGPASTCKASAAWKLVRATLKIKVSNLYTHSTKVCNVNEIKHIRKN